MYITIIVSILNINHTLSGRVYTGLADGRIIRLSEDLESYETVVRTGNTYFDKCGEVQWSLLLSFCS